MRATVPPRPAAPSAARPSLPAFRPLFSGLPLLLAAVAAAQEPAFRVLLYQKGPAGEAYVHTAAKATLKDSLPVWGKRHGFAVDVGEDASVMTAANLAKYQAVVFNNISSEVVDALPEASQRAALMDYVKTGGFIGMHAVSEANRWPDLVSNLGSKMSNHTSEANPATATLNLDPQAASHPIVAGMAATGTRFALGARLTLADEWYTLYTARGERVVPAEPGGISKGTFQAGILFKGRPAQGGRNE